MTIDNMTQTRISIFESEINILRSVLLSGVMGFVTSTHFFFKKIERCSKKNRTFNKKYDILISNITGNHFTHTHFLV